MNPVLDSVSQFIGYSMAFTGIMAAYYLIRWLAFGAGNSEEWQKNGGKMRDWAKEKYDEVAKKAKDAEEKRIKDAEKQARESQSQGETAKKKKEKKKQADRIEDKIKSFLIAVIAKLTDAINSGDLEQVKKELTAAKRSMNRAVKSSPILQEFAKGTAHEGKAAALVQHILTAKKALDKLNPTKTELEQFRSHLSGLNHAVGQLIHEVYGRAP